MREIKFRAWNKKDKRMLYTRISVIFGWIEVIPKQVIPMQFTGLKDKNGKEIYEGDIIYQGDIVMGKIIFQEGGFKIDVNSKNQMPSQINQDRVSHWEVIGNIYENPEFLGAEKRGNTK